MIFYILRGVFILLVAAVAALYLVPNQERANLSFYQFAVLMIAALALAALVIGMDVQFKRKRLSAISGIFLGIAGGLLAAYALSFVVDLIGVLVPHPANIDTVVYGTLLRGVKVILGLITCYVSISLVLQSKDDFRFIIPYVEFAKEIRGQKPMVVDTSVIIDGRIVDLLSTNIIQGLLIVPRFVLDELQAIADSSDKLKRARGRRGLEVLQKLQDLHKVDVHIDDSEVEGNNVDLKLISLCELRQGRLMTNDYNLNKIATLRGIDVVNINDLSKALRPVVLPGEAMNVRIVKAGEGPTQGVGYLDDGTMVVVEYGREHIGQELLCTVTSTLQTSAGRMIFARNEGEATPVKAAHAPSDASSSTSGPHSSQPARNPRRSN